MVTVDERLAKLDEEISAISAMTAKLQAARSVWEQNRDPQQDAKLERMVDGFRDDVKGLREERQALEARLPSSDEHGARSGRLEAIPEGSALAMSEISKSLASLAEGQQRLAEELGEMRVVTQVAALMVWKGMRWTRSTASGGDIRPTNETFKRVLMAKYFPGAEHADIVCMVVGGKTSTIGAHLMSHSKKEIAQALLAINSMTTGGTVCYGAPPSRRPGRIPASA
ncbi:g9518 [Coccomyxa elongata]